MDGVGAKHFYVRMLRSQNVGCWYFGSRGKETERFVSPAGRHNGYWWLGDVVGHTTMTADQNRIPSKSDILITWRIQGSSSPGASSVCLLCPSYNVTVLVCSLFWLREIKVLHWPLAVDLRRWNRLLKITSVTLSILSSYSYLYLTARTSVVWCLIKTKIFAVQM